MILIAEWLNEYLSKELSPTQMAEAMELSGIEVESIVHPPQFDSEIVTATVTEVEPHPDADKLRLATVKVDSESYRVVCGASNLYQGQRVVLARVGAVLPDGTKIGKAEIRGVTSEGMLCSERELGLGQDHDGILDLGPEVDAGVALHTVYNANHAVIDVKTAANRWDLQGYIGIAREVAAHTEAEFIDSQISKVGVQASSSSELFQNQATEQVPSYALVDLRLNNGIKDAPSWMRRRLLLSGIRPVNGVVDITNYVMLVTGQPLHAFDRANIKKSLQIRFAKSDENLTTLDGVKRALSRDDLVIADSVEPIAIAGVIGGEKTEISDTTKTVALEAATFAGNLIRKTAKRHGLRTEASARFERGLPLPVMKQALQYAVSLLVEYVDAEVVTYQNERTAWPWVQHVGVSAAKTAALSGIANLSREDIAAQLKKLTFEARPFDIAEAAREHLGKPYRFGAKFREDGVEAFDCSYLVDYLYSLIGVHVGHTALGQYELGEEVGRDDLRPGDVVFYEGKIENSATDHYYTTTADGVKEKIVLDNPKRVGHNGVYIGDDKVITAAEYYFKKGQWVKRSDAGVVEVGLAEFTENPGYLGARRYVDSLDDYVAITVPWWRRDVTTPEDVLEEVVKLVGLDNVPSTLPVWRPSKVSPDKHWTQTNELRWLLYGLGLNEVTTYPFISEEDIALFRLDNQHLKLANPRSLEQSYLRTSLMPLLAKAAASNATYRSEVTLFEIARVFLPHEDQQLPQEQNRLGIISTDSEAAILGVKGVVDQLLEHAGILVQIDQTAANQPALHPARQAGIHVGSDNLGYFGEVHPDITGKLKQAKHLFYAELDLDELLRHWQPKQFLPLTKYPSSYRDVTIKVPLRVRWQQISESLETIDGVTATFVDEYLKENHKAVTIHLELLAVDTTLNENDINQRMQEISRLLAREFDAETEV